MIKVSIILICQLLIPFLLYTNHNSYVNVAKFCVIGFIAQSNKSQFLNLTYKLASLLRYITNPKGPPPSDPPPPPTHPKKRKRKKLLFCRSKWQKKELGRNLVQIIFLDFQIDQIVALKYGTKGVVEEKKTCDNGVLIVRKPSVKGAAMTKQIFFFWISQ